MDVCQQRECLIRDLDWVWSDERKQPISHTWEWLAKLRKVQEDTGLDYLRGSRAATRMKDADFTAITVQVCPFSLAFK